jgi:hypothetical protein
VALIVAIITGIGLGNDETRLSNEIAFYTFFVLLGIGIPVAIGVSLLKYRLWDLDVVVKKAAVFAVLAVLLVAVFLVVAIAVGGALTGGEEPRIGALIAVSFLIGALLLPMWRLSTKIADRIVYGGRATPYEVLTEFSGRLAETYSSDDVLPRTAAILGEGTGAERVTIWLLVGGDAVPATTWPAEAPEPAPGPDAFEVRHQGELLGSITVTMRSNDPMNPAKERLIRDLPAGWPCPQRPPDRGAPRVPAPHRGRSGRARPQARARHPRRGPAAARRAPVKPGSLTRSSSATREGARPAQQLQSDTHDALDTLRDLARGIYPPLLADKGLPAALDAQARKSSMPVVIEPDGVGRYPEEIEATIYFCVLEAMQNIAKYADANAVTIALQERGERLAFEVRDDGVGFDPETAPRGTGLQGGRPSRDRWGLRISSARGEGTTFAGTVPLTERGALDPRPVPVVESSEPEAAAHADSSRSGPNTAFGI